MCSIRPWIAILLTATPSGCASEGQGSQVDPWLWVLVGASGVGLFLIVRWALQGLHSSEIFPE